MSDKCEDGGADHTGATERPWLHAGILIKQDCGDRLGPTLARCCGPDDDSNAESKANARLIVAAVNTHTAVADLVSSLERCIDVFKVLADEGNYPKPLYNNGGWEFAANALSRFRELEKAALRARANGSAG